MAFLIKKQSFKKLTVILRVTGKLLLKSKDMCLNEIFELTILMLTLCKKCVRANKILSIYCLLSYNKSYSGRICIILCLKVSCDNEKCLFVLLSHDCSILQLQLFVYNR
jgi:hypothetical protein